jgi:hypothetical protein
MSLCSVLWLLKNCLLESSLLTSLNSAIVSVWSSTLCLILVARALVLCLGSPRQIVSVNLR